MVCFFFSWRSQKVYLHLFYVLQFAGIKQANTKVSLNSLKGWNRPICRIHSQEVSRIWLSVAHKTRKRHEDAGTGRQLMSCIFIAGLISYQVYQDSIHAQVLVHAFLSLWGHCEEESISIYSCPWKVMKTNVSCLLFSDP